LPSTGKKTPGYRPERILVIRTDRIGDVVLSTPVLTALRQAFPSAFIAMMVRPYTRELVSGHPHADEILLDDGSGEHAGLAGFFRLLRLVRSSRFDTVLLLHPSLRLALLCFLAHIRHRTGTGYRAYSFLFNHRLFHHRRKSGRHELDLNLDLARALGAPLDHIGFYLHIPEEAHRAVASRLEELGISPGSGFVVLHPGSGGSAMDWPLSGFAILADRIQEELSLAIVITGNKAEAPLVDRLCSMMQSKPKRLDGALSIKELLALLSRAHLLVANSTGPLHMAVAVGCPVVGLYCPLAACAPVRWGPYGHLDSVLTPPLPACGKCTGERCAHSNCMELITSDRVFAKVKEQLLNSAVIPPGKT